VRAVAAGSAGADVWTEIAWLAVAAAADEPVLRHVVADARLMEAAPDRIVAAVLARGWPVATPSWPRRCGRFSSKSSRRRRTCFARSKTTS